MGRKKKETNVPVVLDNIYEDKKELRAFCVQLSFDYCALTRSYTASIVSLPEVFSIADLFYQYIILRKENIDQAMFALEQSINYVKAYELQSEINGNFQIFIDKTDDIYEYLLEEEDDDDMDASPLEEKFED